MAVIYLTHPVHGAKVACLEMEAEYDVQNGWSRYNSEESNSVISDDPESAFVNKLALVVAEPDHVVEAITPVVRRGRPKLAK